MFPPNAIRQSAGKNLAAPPGRKTSFKHLNVRCRLLMIPTSRFATVCPPSCRKLYCVRGLSTAKVMVSIPDEVLKKVDRAAKAQRRSRTEVIRDEVRAQMSEGPEGRRRWKKTLARLNDLEKHWVGQWDSTDIIRYFRDTRHGRDNRR